MSNIRREINQHYKKNYLEQQMPEEDGNPVWTLLGWAYKLFKYSIYLALFTAFVASSQCQGQVEEICQYMQICD
ncbi:hypothetical protein KAR91_17055 [Candidatus Pacearchaeota archaeon]|nr:hypothetical protein [Candidatus Pacearchaeota archaeon]